VPAASDIALSSVIRRFRKEPWATRLYLALRRVVLPFDDIERHVPTTGDIIDACCGHGAFTLLLAMRSPDRRVTGVDIDATRVAAARRVAAGIPNVEFEIGDLLHLDARGATAVVIIDALHYFEPSEQARILRRVANTLGSGGMLVCRTAMRESGPRFWWNALHERVMVGFGLTATPKRGLHFVSRDAFTAMLTTSGLEVSYQERTRPLLPYTDRLFVARVLRNT